MKMEDYYLKLITELSTQSNQNDYLINMEEITKIFNCSKRNAQIILGKLMNEKLIHWYPGQGRGNFSKIELLIPYGDMVLKKAIRKVQSGDMKEAWEIINRCKDESVKISFTNWYYQNFGLKQERNDQDLLLLPLYRPINNLDPAYLYGKSRTELNLIHQLFDTLVVYNHEKKSITPHLAFHWESNDTFLQWCIYIRKGVYFHNSKQLTSIDVKYTLDRLFNLKAVNNRLLKVKSIECLGQFIIQIHLFEPNPLLINFLSLPNFSILPSLSGVDGAEPNFRTPIGTGPFIIKENKESMVSLLANNYYFQGRPQLDRIEMWIVNSENDAYLTKTKINKKDKNNELNKHQEVTIDQTENGCCFLSLNMKKKSIIQDEMLRKALYYGLDQSILINQTSYGKRVLSNSFLLTEDSVKINPYNKKLAIKYIKESNYNGELLSLHISNFPQIIEDANNIKEQYLKLGINLKIISLPVEDFLSVNKINDADLILSRKILDNQTDISLMETFMDNNGIIPNHLNHENLKTCNDMIAFCIGASSEKRIKILTELESKFRKDINIIFLYRRLLSIEHENSIDGVKIDEFGKANLKDIWIRKNRI